MSKWSYFCLAVLGLAVASGIAVFQPSPGYMDADYYFAGGIRLAEGYGYSEQILWNYLDDPPGLPHPSHGYWMPLASILASLSMALTGGVEFANARLGFLLLAACIPPLTARMCEQLGGRRRDAWLAGLLACLPGFYLPYISLTETFGLYMVLGSIALLLVGRLGSFANSQDDQAESGLGARRWVNAFVLGMVTGLMHLTRADGFIWLGVSLVFVLFAPGQPWRTRLAWAGWIGLGYLLCMGPWMARNQAVFGAWLSPGGGRSLWIGEYNELYIYPASLLTMQRWWQAGLGAILQARGWAAGLNLQSALAVQGEIFLAPLILAGLWRLRYRREVQAGLLAWLVTFIMMTLVFPFQGARGGFFHSGAALQPLFWAAVPFGLDAFLQWASRWRGWNVRQASKFFWPGVIFLAALFTGLVVYSRLGGRNDAAQPWGTAQDRYTRVEQALQGWGAPGDAIVLVNNAPGYWLASRRSSLSIPYGDVQTVLEVARRYQAEYLLLEMEQVSGEALYERPGDRPGLRYVGTIEGVRVYEIGLR